MAKAASSHRLAGCRFAPEHRTTLHRSALSSHVKVQKKSGQVVPAQARLTLQAQAIEHFRPLPPYLL